MNEERFWKVKYGFSVSDQVSIKESELEKALYAQIKGQPVQLNNSYINGKNIISITPHYHKHTGWNDWYEPQNGDDWQQIKRDCPNYDGILEAYKQRVSNLLQNNQEHLIGKGEPIKVIEQPKTEYSEEVKRLADSKRI